MNRRRAALVLVVVVAVAALLLAGAPTGLGLTQGSVGKAIAGPCTTAPRSGVADPGATPPGYSPPGASSPMRELRDLLARTPAGGTLNVPAGVYQGALVIDRPVTLAGNGHATLRGDGTGTVLTIRAAGTVVRDLMVEGSGPGPLGNPAGVAVQADHVVVKNLHIRDSYTGVWVEGANDTQIVGNVINGRKNAAVSGAVTRTGSAMAGMAMDEPADKKSQTTFKSAGETAGKSAAQPGRGDGISLFNAVRPLVSGNSIVDARDGVYLEYGSGTRIECNSVVGSRYAIHSMFGKSVNVAGNHFAGNQSGPVMMYGGPVTLQDNVIRDQHSAATGFGVLLLDVSGVRLLRNVLVSNRVGIQLEGPKGDPLPTVVELNTIALNQVGVGLYPTADAVLSQNSLVENTVQVLGYGPDGGGGDSHWNRGGVGNFWSNYRGYDRSGSGIGDIPHVEGAAAGRLLAANPVLLALASSPAFTLMRAVEQRSAGQHPVSVDDAPLIDPRSPPLPSTPSALPSGSASANSAKPVNATLGTGLAGAITLAACALVLRRGTRRRQLPQPERTQP